MTLSRKELLSASIEAFHNATQLRFFPTAIKDSEYYLLQLNVNNAKFSFFAVIKPNLTQATLGSLIVQFKTKSEPWILITSYVNPKNAEYLRKLEIPFIDSVGNAFLNIKELPLFIFLKGNKSAQYIMPATTFVSTAGIKLIFYLLCNPEAINLSYRELAQKSQVALGSINNIVRNLKEKDYLIEIKDKRKLIHIEKLIERWVIAYSEKLRSKLIIGKFKAEKNDWWRDAQIGEGCWGSEVGAYQLTHHLQPEIITLYSNRFDAKVQLKYQLKKDDNGNIEVYKQFWSFEDKWEKQNLVPPLLIYADLLISDDPRNIEVAKIIYEKYLVGSFKEN